MSARINQLTLHSERKGHDYEDALKKFQTTVKFLNMQREKLRTEADSSHNDIIRAMK